MAEEVETVVQEQPAAASTENQGADQGDNGGQSYQAPPANTLAGTEADNIRATLDNLGSFLPQATRDEMEAQIAAIEKPAQPAAATPATPATPAVEKAEDKKPDPAKPAEKKDDEKKDSFKSKFGLTKPGTEKKTDPIVIDTPDQMLGAIKSTFGMELKATTELPKFFDVATGWRKDSEKLKSVETDHKNLTEAITDLPDEFHDAFQRIAQGKDWKDAFTAIKSKIDYNVPAEKQDVRSLVEKYFPEKFTDEDFKEDKPSAALEIAISASQDKFKNEKAAYDNQRASVAETAKKRLEAFKSSVNGSVGYLMKNFPDTEQDVVKSVSSILEGGPQSVLSFFFNEDGSVKPEAAESLMMAKYGKEEIQGMMEIAQHSKETEINEELLTRGADAPKPVQKSSGGASPQITEAEKKQIEELTRLGKLSRQKTF